MIKELDKFELIHDETHAQYYNRESLPTIRQRNRRDGDNHDDDHNSDHDNDHENDHDNDHDDHHDDDHDGHSYSDEDPEASTPSPDEDISWTIAKKWGYATLANSILGE